MTGLVRKATLLSACGLLFAGTAMAFVPSPVTSSVPCGLVLVGKNGANVPDSRGTFTIVVKDIAGNTIPNAAIVIDFTGCCNDLRPTIAQNGGVVTEGNHKKVDVTADGNGSATITIQGVAHKLSPTPNTPGHVGCANIYANGILLTDGTNKPHVNVAVYDLDGGIAGAASKGVHGSDFSVFLGDLFPTPAGDYRQRADLNHKEDTCTDAVTGSDFSRFLSVLFDAGGSSSANDADDETATCP
jgi:hypothetical protein